MRAAPPLLAALAALASAPAEAQTFRRIDTEGRFAAIVVGREIVSADGRERLRAGPDGALEAEIAGERLAGSWGWFEDRMCRVIRRDGAPVSAGCARASIARGRLRLYWNAGGATEYLLR